MAVAASYPRDVATLFADFLAHGGVDVVDMSTADIATAAEVGRLRPDDVVELIVSRDRPDTDALLVPDTAMRTLALIDPLEQRLGKPVLTANQVTVWEGLRLVGVPPPVPGLGTLFRRKGT